MIVLMTCFDLLNDLQLLHVFFLTLILPYSYNAIKGYTKDGRETELSATEHLVSAAKAG